MVQRRKLLTLILAMLFADDDEGVAKEAEIVLSDSESVPTDDESGFQAEIYLRTGKKTMRSHNPAAQSTLPQYHWPHRGWKKRVQKKV
ncbi:hypothetical protein LDENG_00185280 [Lucifuga dentata]|nr:hypothetical protein LDENG_00185280 [Lucifuga dentata]